MIKIKPVDLKAISLVLFIAFAILMFWLVLTFSELNGMKDTYDSSAAGMVVSEEYAPGANGKSGMYRLKAEFEVNGVKYISDFTENDPLRIRKGDTVTVRYKSDDPDSNGVIDKLEHQAVTVTIITSVCLAGAAALFISGTVWDKKQKKQEQ